MFELGDYRHGAALVLQSKGTHLKTHTWLACPEAVRDQRPRFGISCGINCHVHSIFSDFLKMISDWILVALHLLSHTCSTITSELHNTKDKSHNIDNNLSINLLRLLVHPLTLGYCSQTVNSVPGVKDTQEKCQMFFRQICWNIQNYCSQQGLKRTGINKGNCLWCSGDCTLHCLQKQSTPELTVQFGLKKPQTNKKPKLKLTPPHPPKNFRTTFNLLASNDDVICICSATDIAHSHSNLQELCFFSDIYHLW